MSRAFSSLLQCFHRLPTCSGDQHRFFDPFFRILKNRRAHQNTTNVFIYQKQTDNRKWLILSTYITDMYTNITEKKMRKSNIRNSRSLKITVIFGYTSYMSPFQSSIEYEQFSILQYHNDVVRSKPNYFNRPICVEILAIW